MKKRMALKKRFESISSKLNISINSLYDIQRILNNESTLYQNIYSKHKIFYEYKNGLYNLIKDYPSINDGIIIRSKSLDYDRIRKSNILLLNGIKYDLVIRYMTVLYSNTESINQCLMLGFSIWLGLIPKIMLCIWSYKATQLVDPVELYRIKQLSLNTLDLYEIKYNSVYFTYCKMKGIECLQPFSAIDDLLNTEFSELKKVPIEKFDPLDIGPKIETSYQYNMKKLLIVCITLCLFSSSLYQSECINQFLSG